MSKKTLLEKAKELNIPCQNYTKTKQEPKKAIKDNIIKCRDYLWCR